MRSAWMAGAVIAAAIAGMTALAGAAEIRLAEQFSMGYLQFNVMKRDKLIEKYATRRGLKDFKVSWQRFNGPVAMNEALLSNSTDIVSGGVPGLITLWDKTQGTSFEVKGVCALSSQPFLLNTANPDINCFIGFYSYNTPRIYEALKEAGKIGKVTIIGFDEDPITLGGVKEGTIVGTVVQQPYEWGYQGMKDLAKYLEGDKSFIPANKLIIVPTKIIDKSNVDAFWTELKARQGKN